MSISRRTAWLAIALSVLSGACGGESKNPVGPSPPPIGGGQACRTYATEWTTTFTFAPPKRTQATFSLADRSYSHISPAGSTQVVSRTLYDSVADFVDETAVMGRALHRRVERCTTSSCPVGLAEVDELTYDNQRRVATLTHFVLGAPLTAETYSAWDTQGRPTAGTMSQPQPGGCVFPISLGYNDAARTVTVAPGGPISGILCQVLASGVPATRSYDADGNLISETATAGGTSTTATHSIISTNRLCK